MQYKYEVILESHNYKAKHSLSEATKEKEMRNSDKTQWPIAINNIQTKAE